MEWPVILFTNFSCFRPILEASHETREQGGNFRPRTKTHFPRPRDSTYREIRLWGLKEHLVIPSQNCSPLSWSPLCYILSKDLNPSRKKGRSHTSLLLTGVRGGVSTFDIPKKRNRYIHSNETTNTWTKNNMEIMSNILNEKFSMGTSLF